MTSDRAHVSPRRSRSASNTFPFSRRSPDGPLKNAAKRAHPIQTLNPSDQTSSLMKCDIDVWRRRGKRRRRDNSPLAISTDFIQNQERHAIPHPVFPPRYTFPTSSVDFNIRSRRRASYSSPVRSDSGFPEALNHPELTRLRSHAFWELHRSVTESGEGFVQRMRNYERARSWQTSDSTRIIRKRSSVSQTAWTPSYAQVSGTLDDDDVQIFGGDILSSLPTLYHGKSIVSLDASNPKQSETTYSEDTGYRMPVHYSPHCSDNDDLLQANFRPPPPSLPSFPSSTPSSDSSGSGVEYQSVGTDNCLTSLVSSSFAQQPQTSFSEKAVAELSLALASGAGGLNDYRYLQNVTSPQEMDDGAPGELWH